jgi:N-acetylmuramoyl-L-alanine amidase
MKSKTIAMFRVSVLFFVAVFLAEIVFQAGISNGIWKKTKPPGLVETAQGLEQGPGNNLQNVNFETEIKPPNSNLFTQNVVAKNTQIELAQKTVRPSQNLTNQQFKVVINPGHGYYFDTIQKSWIFQRPDIGGVVEDNLNIDLAIKLQQQLNTNQQIQTFSTRELNKSSGLHQSGYPLWQMSSLDNLIFKNLPEYVYNHDTSKLPYEANFTKDLLTRGGYANYLLADALVGVHNNLGGGCGTEVWYDTKNGFGYTSSSLARYINQKLIANLKSRWNQNWCDRGVKASNGDYSETREFLGPAVIVEVGFMDNIDDRNSLVSSVFQQIVAEGIAEGVNDFITSRMAYSYQNISIILILRDGVDKLSIISKIATSFNNQLKLDFDPANPSLKNLNILIFKPEINTNIDQTINTLEVFDSGIAGVSKNNNYKTTPN